MVIQHFLTSPPCNVFGATYPMLYSLPFTVQPTDGDTVTINGVTFTFKTTLGATAGNVLIGGSATNARANLAALIAAPGTTTASGAPSL